jgi:hypothetical protein
VAANIKPTGSAPDSSGPGSSSLDSQASNAANADPKLLKDAKARIKEHISLLHQYNEVRDVGLGLMGMIAEQRGVRVRDVQEEFGVTAKD